MGQAGIGFHQTVQLITGHRVHFLFHIADTAFHIDDVLLGGKKLLVDGMMSVDILVLGKIADIFIPGKHHGTGISRKLLHDDPQQCGLSCTVASDQSSLFTIFNVKGCII